MSKLSFKRFLNEEIVKTKRQSIVHLQDMKPIEFLQFARKLIKDSDGKLQNIPTTLKVDGASGRFGKDKDGKFFFETGASGPIQQSKAFSTHTINKGGSEVMVQRAVHYDNMYDELKASGLWKSFPKDTKVSIEILYNPMAEKAEKDTLKFVSVKYDRKKLGDLMTIIPISTSVASSGDKHIDGDKIIEKLLGESTDKIRIVSPKLKPTSINVKAALEPISALSDDAETILKSLKHADKPLKQEYQVILNAIKVELADLFLKHPIKGRDVLGKEIEGYVVELDGKLYKVTTDVFKAAKRDERHAQTVVKEEIDVTPFKETFRKMQQDAKLNAVNEEPENRDFRKFILADDLAARLPNLKKSDMPSFEDTSGVPQGTMNQIPIYVSGFFPNCHTFIIFNDAQEAVSFVVLQSKSVEMVGEERTIILRSWTRDDMRGKGYATTIYQFLVKKLELKLVCDEKLSADSITMYKQFIQKKKFDKISYYDEKMKKLQDEQPQDLWKTPNKWRIFLENTPPSTGLSPLFGHGGYRRLAEMCYDNEGCF